MMLKKLCRTLFCQPFIIYPHLKGKLPLAHGLNALYIQFLPLDVQIKDIPDMDDFEPEENQIHKIRHAMDQLAEGYRIILTLYLIEGLSHKEIAKMLNISSSTSRSQYVRAKMKLREIIGRKNES